MVKPREELREHHVWIYSASLTSDQNARTLEWVDGLVREGLWHKQSALQLMHWQSVNR